MCLGPCCVRVFFARKQPQQKKKRQEFFFAPVQPHISVSVCAYAPKSTLWYLADLISVGWFLLKGFYGATWNTYLQGALSPCCRCCCCCCSKSEWSLVGCSIIDRKEHFMLQELWQTSSLRPFALILPYIAWGSFFIWVLWVTYHSYIYIYILSLASQQKWIPVFMF